MNERQRQKHERTQSMIIAAAKELIQENGFSQLSLRAIAKRVQYAPASLYEYFESKDAIIDALCAQINRNLIEYMKKEDSLREQSWRYIAFALEFPDDFQLLYHRPLLESEEDRVLTLFREGASKHSSENRELLAYSLWSTVHGLALLALNRELYDSVEDKEYHCQVIDGILAHYPEEQ